MYHICKSSSFVLTIISSVFYSELYKNVHPVGGWLEQRLAYAASLVISES